MYFYFLVFPFGVGPLFLWWTLPSVHLSLGVGLPFWGWPSREVGAIARSWGWGKVGIIPPRRALLTITYHNFLKHITTYRHLCSHGCDFLDLSFLFVFFVVQGRGWHFPSLGGVGASFSWLGWFYKDFHVISLRSIAFIGYIGCSQTYIFSLNFIVRVHIREGLP